MKPFTLLIFLYLLNIQVCAQDTTQIKALPADYLTTVANRLDKVNATLSKKSAKLLAGLEKIERKNFRKLQKTDSTKGKTLLLASKDKYAALKQKFSGSGSSHMPYINYIDTLKTSLKFLADNKGLLTGTKNLEQQMVDALSKIKQLEQSLANAESIKAFVKERKQYLAGLGFAKELKNFNKRAFYGLASLSEIKETIKDKKKLEQKAMKLLAGNKNFQDFLKKNSVLTSLFRIPGADDAGSGASLQGLQTRAQVNSLIQGRIAAGGPGAGAQVQANIQAAQAQLNELKDKVAKLGGGSSNGELPEFRVNPERGKSFFKRVELGADFQSQKAKGIFPNSSELGLSANYRLSDLVSAGIGASLRTGWGNGWDHISITYQGVGIRSQFSYRIKKSFYLSAGYELNYRSQIKSFETLKDYNAFQKSGLVGVTKKYAVSKKLKGNMQLLWDFMSYRQVPKTQSIIIRVGYSFK